MNEYTAEDFKNANIAVRGTLHAARRAEPDTTLPWVYGDNVWEDDKGMAENGWRPIHEHNLHATDAREEEIQALRDASAGLKMRVEYLNGELALWQERASQAEAHARKAEAAPLTLDTLRDAWEEAEVPTDENPVRKGDVLIRKDDDAAIDVWECQTGHHPAVGETRILSRAPREPWADLADDLADRSAIMDEDAIEAAAKALHAAGWRKGGDDA